MLCEVFESAPGQRAAPAVLPATRYTVEIRRRLAEANPAAYELDLTTSLCNSAVFLAAGGDLTGALHVTGDAMKCYRAHITVIPFLFPRLNNALNLQVRVLDALGRPQDAATPGAG